tara:strand:- start:30 stop:200 length:171 start_codon:yes stop_codon:yes gene_type:complete
MAKYKLIAYDGKTVAILQKEGLPPNTSRSFPLDEGNTDYQEYLAWVAEGNTAEAAD